MGSAAVEAIWMHRFLKEQGLTTEPPLIKGDSSSALQLASRVGQGRLKHVEVRLLALQQWHQQGSIRLQKVPTQENIADLFTKHLAAASKEKLEHALGIMRA